MIMRLMIGAVGRHSFKMLDPEGDLDGEVSWRARIHERRLR